MEELLKMLGQEMYDQVVAKLGGKVLFLHNADQKVIIDDGKSHIPKHRFDEVIAQRDALQAQADQSDKDLKALKAAAKGNDDLVAQITALQEAQKTAKADFVAKESEMKKVFAIKEGLLNAGVLDEESRDLLLPRFKLAEVELDESGKVKDFDVKVKPLKEHKALSALFSKTKIVGPVRKDGKTTTGYFSREEVENMTDEDAVTNYDAIQESMGQWEPVKK